jgi:FkbM family methyltransferase
VLGHYAGHGLRPDTIIDVGVAAGTPELYAAFPDARLVLVEPLEEWRGHLEQLAERRRTEVVIAAAGRERGERSMTVHRVPALSTMMGHRPGDPSNSASRVVPVLPLDDAVQELGVSGPVVLKVDVEGAEIEVLEGATNLLSTCELVLLEVSFVELIDGAPLFADVVGWMYKHGFLVADLYNGHNRPLDGALAQMDVAFLPRKSPLRVARGYGSASHAEGLYRSWGY